MAPMKHRKKNKPENTAKLKSKRIPLVFGFSKKQIEQKKGKNGTRVTGFTVENCQPYKYRIEIWKDGRYRSIMVDSKKQYREHMEKLCEKEA